MHKLIRGKLVLLLTAILFAGSFPVSASVVCRSKSYSIASRGNDGRSGTNGRDETVIANGSPVVLDLSGGNGQDGRDGASGSSSYCGSTSYDVDYDVRARDGDSGEDGGRGGDGGNGGSLTVYYSNLEDLKKILVRANSGSGGRGGRGGSGSAGCRCTVSSWQKTECTGTAGTPSYQCKTKNYYCTDGSYGRNGSNGADGKQGRLGILSLVKGKELLPQEIPTARLSLSELAARPLKLRKNIWIPRSGASSLLAPGSIIADGYREFERQLEANIKLDWQEKLPISRFSDEIASLALNDNNQVSIDFSDELWVDSSSKTEGNSTVLTVNHIIAKKDVTRLRVTELTNFGQNLNLILVDLGGRADVLKNQFRLKLRVQTGEDYSNFDYKKLYDGELSANLIQREHNRLFLALGKLPISASELRPGAEIEVELEANRSLGIRSAKQNIRWKGTIRRPR